MESPVVAVKENRLLKGAFAVAGIMTTLVIYGILQVRNPNPSLFLQLQGSAFVHTLTFKMKNQVTLIVSLVYCCFLCNPLLTGLICWWGVNFVRFSD